MQIPPPQSEQELLDRCRIIAGKTIFELAHPFNQKIPTTLHQAKGWVGTLIEWHLGADSTNKSQPDFSYLGIELKTLPLDADYRPQESTYVCTAPLEPSLEIWRTSRVYKKLAHVLWVPIEASSQIPIPERRIGTPLLWRPCPKTEAILKQDWEELTEILQLGQIAKLSAKQGFYLQIRPKAAHSRILTSTLNEQGEAILTGPKGFYLRTLLTKNILANHYKY